MTANHFALVNLTKAAPSRADVTDASSAFVQMLSNVSGSYNVAIGPRNLCARLIAPDSMGKAATAWACESWSKALEPAPKGPIAVSATPAMADGDDGDDNGATPGDTGDDDGDVTIISVGPMEAPMNILMRQVAHSLDGLQYALVTIPIAAAFAGLAALYLGLSYIKTLNPSIALVAAAIAMSTSFVALLLGIIVLVAASDVSFRGTFGLAATLASFGASLGSILTATILCLIATVLHWRVYALERQELPIDLDPPAPVQSVIIERPQSSAPVSQPRPSSFARLPQSVVSVEVDTVEVGDDKKM